MKLRLNKLGWYRIDFGVFGIFEGCNADLGEIGRWFGFGNGQAEIDLRFGELLGLERIAGFLGVWGGICTSDFGNLGKGIIGI